MKLQDIDSPHASSESIPTIDYEINPLKGCKFKLHGHVRVRVHVHHLCTDTAHMHISSIRYIHVCECLCVCMSVRLCLCSLNPIQNRRDHLRYWHFYV